jgi:hypothetical protein
MAGASSLPTGAVPAQGLLPGRDRAGHADAEAAGDPLGEGDGLAGGRVDEAVLAEGRRGGLAAVDGDHPALAGQVDDHEPAAADAGRVGLGDPEGGRGRDRGVDRVAAAPQGVDRGLCGERIHRCGGSSSADRGGFLLLSERRGGRDEQDDEDGQGAHESHAGQLPGSRTVHTCASRR